ncbi:MAG: hypothetical protein FDW93_01800 [Bergeyella sp.]|nr:hypothetical protein [Bergeyella sp.]
MSETLAKISLRSFGFFFLVIVLLVTFVSCVAYPSDGYSETDGVYYDPSTDTLPLGYGSYESGVGDYYQYGQNGNGNVYPGIIEKNKMNTEERKRRFSGIYRSKNSSLATNWGRYAGNDVYYTSYGYGWGWGMGPFWWSHDPFYYGWGYNPYWIFGLSWGWDYPWYSGFYYPYGYGGYYGSHYGRGYGHNYLYSRVGRLNGYNTPNPHSPNGYINRNQNSYNGGFGSGKRNEESRYDSRYNNNYRGGMKIPDSQRYYGADGESMRSSGYNNSSGWRGDNNGGFHNSNSGGFRGGSSSGGGSFGGGGFSGGPSGGGFHGN